MPESMTDKFSRMRVPSMLDGNPTLTFSEVQSEKINGKTVRSMTVKLVARTDSVVEHSKFGPIVHDLQGMSCRERVSLDWRHNDEDLIGYLDRFEKLTNQIVCYGKIISLKEGDQADTIMLQYKAGIPLEASIYFGGQGIKHESYDKGQTAVFNGQEYEGPVIVFTKWPMRRVAICPSGADNSTEVYFGLEDGHSLEAVISSLRKEEDMTVKPKGDTVDNQQSIQTELEAKLSEKQAELDIVTEKLASRDQDHEILSPDGKTGVEFIEAFGDTGAVSFAKGLSFAQAQTEHIKILQARLEDIETRLTQADRGDNQSTDADSGDGDDDETKLTEQQEKVKKLKGKMSGGLAKFAAGIEFADSK